MGGLAVAAAAPVPTRRSGRGWAGQAEGCAGVTLHARVVVVFLFFVVVFLFFVVVVRDACKDCCPCSAHCWRLSAEAAREVLLAAGGGGRRRSHRRTTAACRAGAGADLDVAARLGGRAVSVHCVQATGQLLDVLHLFPTTVAVDAAAATAAAAAAAAANTAATAAADDDADAAADASAERTTATTTTTTTTVRGGAVVVLRVALHSFTGSPNFVRSLLALEEKRARACGAIADKGNGNKRRHHLSSPTDCLLEPRSSNSTTTTTATTTTTPRADDNGVRGGAAIVDESVPVLFEFYFGFSVGVNCSQLVRGNGSSSNGIINVDGGGASSCCCSSSGSSNNANCSNSQWTKLEASIKAVPRDRTLLETDRAAFGEEVAGDLCRMCEVIAAASGGTLAASGTRHRCQRGQVIEGASQPVINLLILIY